jgi:hypothetical protein
MTIMTKILVTDLTGCEHKLSGPMAHAEGRGAIQCTICGSLVVQVLDSKGYRTGDQQVIKLGRGGRLN